MNEQQFDKYEEWFKDNEEEVRDLFWEAHKWEPILDDDMPDYEALHIGEWSEAYYEDNILEE